MATSAAETGVKKISEGEPFIYAAIDPGRPEVNISAKQQTLITSREGLIYLILMSVEGKRGTHITVKLKTTKSAITP